MVTKSHFKTSKMYECSYSCFKGEQSETTVTEEVIGDVGLNLPYSKQKQNLLNEYSRR